VTGVRAVWSWWTKPYLGNRSGIWRSTSQHLASWILSYETARQHYADTALYTDDLGARILIDGLGLRFAEVSTALNALTDFDASWWSAGKFIAFQQQSEPFVHLDYDVYLWKALPEPLTSAQVFTEHPEHIDNSWPDYQPALVESALALWNDTWLPTEWAWYRGRLEPQVALCCGIVGGSNVEFLRYYANVAMRTLSHPRNKLAFANLEDKHRHMVLMEQWLLSACVEYHGAHPESPFNGVTSHHLLQTLEEALDPERTSKLGYTHLISTAKQDPRLARRLEERVERDYPVEYARAVDLATRVTLF
jgi:Family of unknown function (DUF6734)